jgi:hypothetical protein
MCRRQLVFALANMTIKIVAVFPKGGEASKNEKYVNCVENALGLREWCDKNKAELVVTESKDGDDSGEHVHQPYAQVRTGL